MNNRQHQQLLFVSTHRLLCCRVYPGQPWPVAYIPARVNTTSRQPDDFRVTITPILSHLYSQQRTDCHVLVQIPTAVVPGKAQRLSVFHPPFPSISGCCADTVFLGAAPVGFLGHADEMRAKGVVGVINMCGEYQGPLEDYSRLGIEQLWLPTVVRAREREENPWGVGGGTIDDVTNIWFGAGINSNTVPRSLEPWFSFKPPAVGEDRGRGANVISPGLDTCQTRCRRNPANAFLGG